MKALSWSFVVLGAFSAFLGALLICPLNRSTCGGGNARNAQVTLKTLASAQADFAE